MLCPQKKKNERGFTILELLVAVSLFVTVTMIVGSSFLGVVDAYRKASAIRLNIDNLNSSVESIVRGVKTGTGYYCGPGGSQGSVSDCASGGKSYFSFLSSSGKYVIYCLGGNGGDQCGAGTSANQIFISTDGSPFVPLTAPPPLVTITSLKFYVTGTSASNNTQPRVLIAIQGTTGIGRSVESFSTQTTIVQRVPNLGQ